MKELACHRSAGISQCRSSSFCSSDPGKCTGCATRGGRCSSGRIRATSCPPPYPFMENAKKPNTEQDAERGKRMSLQPQSPRQRSTRMRAPDPIAVSFSSPWQSFKGFVRYETKDGMPCRVVSKQDLPASPATNARNPLSGRFCDSLRSSFRCSFRRSSPATPPQSCWTPMVGCPQRAAAGLPEHRWSRRSWGKRFHPFHHFRKRTPTHFSSR